MKTTIDNNICIDYTVIYLRKYILIIIYILYKMPSNPKYLFLVYKKLHWKKN